MRAHVGDQALHVTEIVRRPSSAASQTMTFLFADLRDYTRFVEQFGDAAASTLIGDYRRIVRAEVAKAAGAEVKTEGDSFYVVFTSARAAVSCAVAILREAERYSKDRPDRPIKVGVGIHAGEPVPHEGQYVGAAVILAARLAQSAGPGELLVSEVVRGLLPRDTAPPMREREGLALKGIEAPPRIFDVGWRDVPRRPARAQASGVEVAVPAALPADRRVLCPEMVGREAELERLVSFLDRASRGEGTTVLVGGEAGLGKSALLRAFAERVTASGALLLLGECTEVEARRPFGPFIDALAAAGLALPAELAQGGPGAQPVAEAERYRVHAGFARALADAAGDRPVAVAVEDLHWADEATLELVPYLARKLRSDRVLLLGTYRTDELHRTHPLNHLLAELARGRLAEEIRLERLSPDETAAVIKGALGLDRAPTTAFREAIHERCEGNPFFIEEVLRALVEGGDLKYRDGAWRRTKEVADLAIPVSIRDAVQQRLRALPADARRAMHVAAVIGQRFGFDLLERVSGIAEPALVEAIRAAVDEQLVEEEGGRSDEAYRFRHALTRETVLGELLQRERRLLHRAVAEAIERGARGDVDAVAEELAYHFDEAHESAKAYTYRDLAAGRARRVFAYGREVRHLERAIELAPDADPGLTELYLRLADATYALNDIDRAERAADEARGIAEASGDATRSAAALRRLARIAWWRGDRPLAQERAARAVEVLEGRGESAELAGAHAELARLDALAEKADAGPRAERAIAIARRVGAAQIEADAMITLALARRAQHATDWEAILRAAAEIGLREGHHAVVDRAWQNLYAGTAYRGADLATLRKIHEEGLEQVRRFGIRSETLVHREALDSFFAGEWDRCLEVIAAGRSATHWSAGRDLMEALIRTAREGPQWLSDVTEAARRRAYGSEETSDRAGALWSAAAAFIAGDPAATLRAAEPAADALERGGYPQPHEAAVVAVLAAERLSDDAALERWLRIAETPYTGGWILFEDARIAFAQGVRARRAGDAARALERFADAAERSEALVGMDLTATLARLERADLLLARGERDAAQRELDAALPFWRKAKATFYLTRLADRARDRGLTLAT